MYIIPMIATAKRISPILEFGCPACSWINGVDKCVSNCFLNRTLESFYQFKTLTLIKIYNFILQAVHSFNSFFLLSLFLLFFSSFCLSKKCIKPLVLKTLSFFQSIDSFHLSLFSLFTHTLIYLSSCSLYLCNFSIFH